MAAKTSTVTDKNDGEDCKEAGEEHAHRPGSSVEEDDNKQTCHRKKRVKSIYDFTYDFTRDSWNQ